MVQPRSQTQAPDRLYAAADAAVDFAQRLLAAHDVPAADAALVARCLVDADLRGVDTHGLVRLPGYLASVRRGLINPRPALAPQQITSVAAALDGQNGFGFVVATRAMEQAVTMARAFGVGVVAARRSTHFGMAASYVLPAIAAGFVAVVFSNASRAMPPWGGRDAFLGTSPLAIGAPGGRLSPVLLDMSPAVAARGKIRRAVRRGEPIPLGYALDAQGEPTTDPVAALKGVVLPIGGPKGSGLALLMDIFCGVLSGAAYAGDVGDQYKDFDRPQNVGHFFLALKPDLFVPLAEYQARMDRLVERLRQGPKAAGFSEILLPGEPETREAAVRRRRGLPYSGSEIAALQQEAAQAGVAMPPLSPRPLDMPGE